MKQHKNRNESESIRNDSVPEPWGRLPKPKGRLWGLSRTTILEMCERGEIKSIVIKKRGASRGIRLICMQSFADSLEKRAVEYSKSTIKPSPQNVPNDDKS